MMQERLLMCKVKAKIHFAGLTELYSIGLGLILVSPIFGIFVKECLVFYLEVGRSMFLNQCCYLRTFVPA